MARAKTKEPDPPQQITAAEAPDAPSSVLPTPSRFEMNPQEFFQYWDSIPPEIRNAQIIVYPYRVLPVCDNTQGLSSEDLEEIRRKHKKKPETNLGKMVDPISPDGWAQQLAEWKGAGDYHFKLNNIHPSVKKTICMTTTSGEGPLRDWDSYPPVLELTHVVLTEKRNQPYIRWAHLNGIRFPGEPGIETSNPSQEKQDDMAAIQAVETLTNALVEQSKNNKSATPPDTGAASLLGQMLKASEERHVQEMRISEERHAREMAAMEKRLEEQAKVSQDRCRDPLATTQSVIDMAKQVAASNAPPPPPDNKMVEVLMQLLKSSEERALQERKLDAERHKLDMEMAAKRTEAQEARVAALEAQRNAQPQTQGKSAIQEAISLVKALKGATEEINGDSGSGTGNPWVDLAADLGPRVLDTIGTVTTALRSSAPAPMQQAPQQSGAIQQQQAQPQQQDTSEMGQNAIYARMIKDPLIQALQNSIPGHQFAGRLIVQLGDPAYQFLAQQGEQGVLNILQSAPEVWGEVIKFGGPRVQQFLGDFLNVPAALEQAAMIRAGQGQRPTAAPSPAATARPQQARTVVVDAVPMPAASTPASEVPQTSGRTIVSPDGRTVKTKPVVNGGVTDVA